MLVTINSLQEMTSDICENTYLPTNTISTTTTSQYFSLNRVPQATLVDTRDNISYRVRKFADGNCWIVDNLRLGSTGAITLTPDDSDVDSNFNLPQASTTASSWTSVSMYQYTPLLYNTGNSSYGVFYNWHAVTAGSELYPLEIGAARPFIASNSICPKGWRLPTLGVGDNADYARFIKAYNYTSGNVGTARKNVFNITTAGQYEPVNGEVQGRGSNGNWWTSVYTGEDAGNYGIVNLFIRTDTSSSSQAITYGSSRMYYGNSVRCVAR